MLLSGVAYLSRLRPRLLMEIGQNPSDDVLALDETRDDFRPSTGSGPSSRRELGRTGFEPVKAKPEDLQSSPVGHLGICPGFLTLAGREGKH